MQEIPWLTDVLTVLSTEGVTAAEAVLERALEGATPAERADVDSAWVEVLVAEQQFVEAIARLDDLIAGASTDAIRGQLAWRQARLLAATGNTDRSESSEQERKRARLRHDARRRFGKQRIVRVGDEGVIATETVPRE